MSIIRKFIDCCFDGNIVDIKKMSLTECDLDKGFRVACINGHLDIVKYFVELYKTGDQSDPKNSNYKPINIHTENEYGFIWACNEGHYMIVKYLVELYKNDQYDKINIHIMNEGGFRGACYYNHYEVVKYLIEAYKIGHPNNTYDKINIHSYDELYFKLAYRRNNYMIIKYLMTICKKHKYKPFNSYLIIFEKFNKYKL